MEQSYHGIKKLFEYLLNSTIVCVETMDDMKMKQII